MVESEAALVVVIGQDLGRQENRWRNIAQRIKLFCFQRNGTEKERRNLIAGKWLARKFVDQRHGLASGWIDNARKITRALRRGRNNCGLRFTLHIALAFIVDKEEIFIAANGAAQSRSKLILVQRLGCRGEKIPRIEGVVTEEFIKIAVETVSAGLRNNGRCRAACLAILSGGIRGENAKLADGVRRCPDRKAAIHAIHVRDAIRQVVVRLRPLAINGEALSAAQDPSGLGKAGGRRCDARLEKDQAA